jgi:hypothetical protein
MLVAEQSNDLFNLSINGFWRGGGSPTLHDVAFLVHEEFLKVPLRFR